MQNKNTILVVDDQSINIDFIVTNSTFAPKTKQFSSHIS